MIKGEDKSKVVPIGAPATASDQLSYTIELWDLPRNGPERVIGRAASMVLARAIFAAAQTEHLGRRLILRRGAKVVQESG
jgi:hypothetical protein